MAYFARIQSFQEKDSSDKTNAVDVTHACYLQYTISHPFLLTFCYILCLLTNYSTVLVNSAFLNNCNRVILNSAWLINCSWVILNEVCKLLLNSACWIIVLVLFVWRVYQDTYYGLLFFKIWRFGSFLSVFASNSRWVRRRGQSFTQEENICVWGSRNINWFQNSERKHLCVRIQKDGLISELRRKTWVLGCRKTDWFQNSIL